MKDNAFSMLREHSALLGRDPCLIQGAGGNTSIKQDGVMWIKASGKWLMHADKQDIFVPVELQSVVDALSSGDTRAEKSVDFVVDELNPQGLRPSIETTLHAVMKQRVVIHVHCVDTIALAIREDAEKQLAARLAGFEWTFIPYIRPGLPLSQSVKARLRADTDVLVLGNHGLVVAADTVEACLLLLERVRLALLVTPRTVTERMHGFGMKQDYAQKAAQTDRQNHTHGGMNDSDADASSATETRRQDAAIGVLHDDYQPAEAHEAHAIAFDRHALDVAAGGSLYPDHVIFLGEGTVVAREGEDSAAVVERCEAAGDVKPVSIVFPGVGVALATDATPGQQAMARCLTDVCLRVPEGTAINYFNKQQNAELLNWEAEQYRRTLNQ